MADVNGSTNDLPESLRFRIQTDLGEVMSLLEAIKGELLAGRVADGSYDSVDVMINLGVQRAGQLVEAVNRSLGNVGFFDDGHWLPGPESLKNDTDARRAAGAPAAEGDHV